MNDALDGYAEVLVSHRFSRRRFISTAGVTVTLPLLPSLMWTKKTQAACAPTKRFMVYHFPNGHHMAEHVPTGVGSGGAWALSPMLMPLQDLKTDLTFVSGLENQMRRRETGDHAIGLGSMLTGVKPTKNTPVNCSSVDQIIADAMMGCRGIHSLQLGTQNSGPTDSFGTYYTRSISWRGPAATSNADGSKAFGIGAATPLSKEIDLSKAFTRMFQGTDPAATTADAAMRLAMRKSVLDTVTPHGDWLRARLNSTDRAKVDELFTGIRSLELEIESTTSGGMCTKPPAPDAALVTVAKNTNSGTDFAKQLDTWHTLMALAFQCDVTRVITFMMGDAINNRDLAFIPSVTAIGGSGADHAVSHYGSDAVAKAKFREMVLWKQGQIGNFLRKLKALTDADGQSVLNNTLVFVSSELADGNRHNHDGKPILLAGRLGGLVVPDRHVAYPMNKDYTMMKSYGDFFITLLGLYDVKVNTFGMDGKEALTWDR